MRNQSWDTNCGTPCSYQLGCTVSAVSAQRSVEHAKNAVQNITTDWTPQCVLGMKDMATSHELLEEGLE